MKGNDVERQNQTILTLRPISVIEIPQNFPPAFRDYSNHFIIYLQLPFPFFRPGKGRGGKVEKKSNFLYENLILQNKQPLPT